MTLARTRSRGTLHGHARPRIAPPLPARTLVKEYRAAAVELGINLMEWQDIVGRYLTALGPTDKWLYRRVATAVARQNGKTEIIKPRVVMGLKMGRQQLHIAQDRLRPRRSTFEPLADFLTRPEQREQYGIKAIRFANGQEQILCVNGGSYTILAPKSGGARGGSFDDIYVDEAREFEEFEVEAIIRPTTTARPNAQIMYFSSAGHERSVVLNAIRERRDDDPRLAYLEWSADPSRAIDDRIGWAEANPALGTLIEEDTLADDLRSMQVREFETEHLCRWVNSMREPLVDLSRWKAGEGPVDVDFRRPFMAVSIDPAGQRASAAVAWPLPDGKIATRLLFDVTGNPIDPDRLGRDLQDDARKRAVQLVGFDPLTDALLAKHFPNTEAIAGAKFANGTARFVELVEGGRLVWADAGAVSEDLAWTARKPHDESGSFQAVRAQDDRPITAALATIRAVWLASAPGLVSVYSSERPMVSV